MKWTTVPLLKNDTDLKYILRLEILVIAGCVYNIEITEPGVMHARGSGGLGQPPLSSECEASLSYTRLIWGKYIRFESMRTSVWIPATM